MAASTWLEKRTQTLVLAANPSLRTAFTTWLREYGRANGLVGLGTGTLESRLSVLRRIRHEDAVLLWTTAARWAEGAGLTLRFPELGIDVGCSLADGVLSAEALGLTQPGAADPLGEPGSVGAVIRAAEVAFRANGAANQTVLAQQLQTHFDAHAHNRWGGFVGSLKQSVEAEAAALERRRERLTLPFVADPSRPATLRLTQIEAAQGYEAGEWLEIVNSLGASTPIRLIATLPNEGLLEIDAHGHEVPQQGHVRPRQRARLIEQKRAIVRQLEVPTGDLPGLVRLVAAPELAQTPDPESRVKFINSAVASNPAQALAVRMALGLTDGQALFIVGPPGTGKSTTAAEINLQLLRRDPRARILVCAHSNHGADNLLAKVLPFVADPVRHLARVGAYDRLAPAALQYFTADEETLASRNLVFTTIDSLGLQDIAGARMYDCVILDEANRAGVTDSLLALARGQRMILIGDPMQLQPVVSDTGQAPADTAETSLFVWLMERGFPASASVFLDEQNRMHPDIASVISRVFYAGRIRSGPAAPHQAAVTALFPDAVTWVDTSTLEGSREERQGTSFVNVAEAELVVEITRYIAEFAEAGLSIGVIAAYAQQRNLLLRLFAELRLPGEREVEVDTVDAFEGREKDLMVLSLVRANQLGTIGFLRNEQRLNVALSRARRGLVVVGDTTVLHGGHLDALLHAVRDNGAMRPAYELAQLDGSVL